MDPGTVTDWRRYADDEQLPGVLEAALEVFVRLGYHGTTVRAIATRAGLSVPGIYHHFESKQEMLAALLRRSNEELMLRARLALDEADPSPRSRFVALVENVLLYMTHRRRLARVARELHVLDEPYRTRHVELRDELEHLLLHEVEAACAEGEFLTDDPREATRAILVLCQGVADWYAPGGPKTPEQIADQYLAFSLALVVDRGAAERRPA